MSNRGLTSHGDKNTLRTIALLAVVAPGLACSRPTPKPDGSVATTTTGTVGADPTEDTKAADPPVEVQRPPDARAMSPRPLGEAPWTAIAATHERDGLLVGMPRALKRVDAAGEQVRWETPLEETAAFVAASADGRRAAALVPLQATSDYRLVVVDAKTGAGIESPRFGLPSPPDRDRGRQPPTRPTGLTGAPGSSSFWIVNAYGTWSLSPGHRDGTDPEKVANFSDTQSAQDGSAGWIAAKTGLTRLDATMTPTLEVDLGCYPQQFAVEPRGDRVVTLCVRKQERSVRLHALKSGELLREWPTRAWPQFAITGADEFWMLEDNPGAVARVREGEIERRPQSKGWGGIQVSPSGKTVLARGAGVVRAIDLESGKVRCTLSAAAWGAGLEDDDTAWLLGFSPDVFNALQLQRADLAACELGAAKPLDLGKTTNLGAAWLPKPRAFAFNALYGKSDYGPTLVGVDGSVRHLAARATPRLKASPDGRYLAMVASDRATLYDVSAEPARELKTVPEAAKVALCDDFALAYMWNKGWVAHGYDGEPPVVVARGPFAPQPQVDSATCRGGVLVVGRVNHWFVLDPVSGRFLARWDNGQRVGPLALTPDGQRAVFSGGPTGLQLAPIR